MNILWDWNGTLLDDVELSLIAINKVLIEFNLNTIDLSTYKKYYRFPISDYYRDIGFDNSYKAQISQRFFYHYNHEFIKINSYLFSNSKRKLLTQIEASGHKNYILSAREQTCLNKELALLNIRQLFLKVYGASSSLSISKEQQLNQLISNNVIIPSETILVGDTISDYELAKKNEIKCFLFSEGHQSKERLISLSNVILIDSLEIITELI